MLQIARSFIVLSVFLFAVTLYPASQAYAGPWQEGYVVQEGSTSPNGQYGVLIPGREMMLSTEGDEFTNDLVDLKSHRSLGNLGGGAYAEGENHRGLKVRWSPDSSWCVVEYDARFGFESISVLNIQGESFTQTDIGQFIQAQLDKMIAKESGSEEAGGEANPYYRLSSTRKLRVRAIATTDPKALDYTKTYCSLFQGTFDITSGKWTVTDARSVEGGDYIALGTAYDDHIDEHVGFSTEEGKAESLDGQMNDVYAAVRLLLPPERFAKVKKEQLAWLRVRDNAKSPAEKCRLLEARIRALQDLVW